MIALWQPRTVDAVSILCRNMMKQTYLPISKGVEKNFKGELYLEDTKFNIAAL